MGVGAYWDKTWNLTVGCHPVSKGCDNCFAVPTSRIRAANPNPAVAAAFEGVVTPVGTDMRWTGRVNQIEARLDDPYRWQKPWTIYLTLLGDMFHAAVTTPFLAKAFARIATTGRHTYLCTTKQQARMRSLLNDPQFEHLVRAEVAELDGRRGAQEWDGVWPLRNLYLGVSVEDQGTADLRIPALLETPAAVRWISAEPLLGRIDLTRIASGRHRRQQLDVVLDVVGRRYGVPGRWAEPLSAGLDWVVTGGESASQRPTHPDWFRTLRDQCVAAGIPFWFKQHGEFLGAAVVDDPHLYGGRAVIDPRTGRSRGACVIREPGPSGTMRTATTRPMRPGDRTRGGVLLDVDTFAMKVGTRDAGRILDGRVWNQVPACAP